MKYLFPHRFKKFGLLVLVPSVLVGVFIVITDWSPEFLDYRFTDENGKKGFLANNLLNEIIGVLVVLSGLLVAFSKEKIEDEFIEKVRLESLVWSVYVNYILLFLAMVLLYDFDFLWFMTFNMFTILIFFIIRFNWQVSKLKREASNEK